MRRFVPWLVVGGAFAVLMGRAWFVQSSATSPEGPATNYLSLALESWLQTSWRAVLFVLPFSITFTGRPHALLDRIGWALAVSTTFFAFVPPRLGNYMASGSADDEWLLYIPVAIVTGVVTCVLMPITIDDAATTFAIATAIGAGLGSVLTLVQGGAGHREVMEQEWLLMMCSVAVVVVVRGSGSFHSRR